MENTFYTEHILNRFCTHRCNGRTCRARSRPRCARFYREHILWRTHSIQNTFYREHILSELGRDVVVPGSIENTFYREHNDREHILQRTHSIRARSRRRCARFYREHILWRTHSIQNTFYREHILSELGRDVVVPGSTENTFYTEHVLQRTHSTENTFYQSSVETSSCQACILKCLSLIENTFYRQHILQRTHSIENAFYRQHVLQRTDSTETCIPDFSEFLTGWQYLRRVFN